jgi:hypothetical protein
VEPWTPLAHPGGEGHTIACIYNSRMLVTILFVI